MLTAQPQPVLFSVLLKLLCLFYSLNACVCFQGYGPNNFSFVGIFPPLLCP